jgi:hypothetical protein
MKFIRKRNTDNTCYKIGNMILTLNVKNIFLFSALVGGVLATNNFRQLKTRHSDKATATTSSYQGPSITLDKETYDEGEDITVYFSVGRPNDEFYSSADAPSLNLDFNYPKWRIGLFMRDADPQGGSLEPIVGINLCGALNCDPNNLDFEAYTSRSVTFGSEFESLLDGKWPVKMNDYGQGLDAYVLDAKGAAAIGPFEFEIHKKEMEEVPKKLSGLAKYNHADMKDTARQHTGTSKAALTAAKLHDANGLVSPIHAAPHGEGTKTASKTSVEKNYIFAEKKEYQADEPVSITFSLDDVFKNEDKFKFRVGIFPSTTQPHGGTVDPIASIPICGEKDCADMAGTTEGQVTFSRKTTEAIKGHWPIDFNKWGNEFNVFVLDDIGATILGPEKISILTDEYA